MHKSLVLLSWVSGLENRFYFQKQMIRKFKVDYLNNPQKRVDF